MKKLFILFALISFNLILASETNHQRNQTKKQRTQHLKEARWAKKELQKKPAHYMKNTDTELIITWLARRGIITPRNKYFRTTICNNESFSKQLQKDPVKKFTDQASETTKAEPIEKKDQKSIHEIPADIVALLLEGGVPPKGHFLNDPAYMEKFEWKIVQ